MHLLHEARNPAIYSAQGQPWRLFKKVLTPQISLETLSQAISLQETDKASLKEKADGKQDTTEGENNNNKSRGGNTQQVEHDAGYSQESYIR